MSTLVAAALWIRTPSSLSDHRLRFRLFLSAVGLPSVTTRATIALLGGFTTYWLVALQLDRATDAIQQLALATTAWVVLGIALALQPRDVRVQVAVLVCIATVLEIVGSLVWGAYRYRLDNLPLYVPAGHGLFYLAALRTAALPLLVWHRRTIMIAVTAGATAYMAWGLVRPAVVGQDALPDLLGFVTWAVFIRFMVRGRYPLLYAVSFVLTMALEFYGTGLGIWRWSPVLPGLMLPAGNPPTGVGAGYCAMDALTRRAVARLSTAGDVLARLRAPQACLTQVVRLARIRSWMRA